MPPAARFRFHALRRYSTISTCPITSTTALAFDMDGVLIRGGRAIPSAHRALQKLKGDNPLNREIPFIILTNSGGESEDSKAHKLSQKLGVEIHPSQIVLSHSPMRHLAPQYKNKLVHVVGPDECKNVARSYGFSDVVTSKEIKAFDKSIWPYRSVGDEMDDTQCPYDLSQTPISATLIFHDPTDWGLDIQLITDTLASQTGLITTRQPSRPYSQSTPLYSSNADFQWSNEWPWPRYGQGAFVTALDAVWKRLSGIPLVIEKQFGKPSGPTFEFAEKMLSAAAGGEVNRVYMVGDNPDSDIAGANLHGWVGVLVKSGVYRAGMPLTKENKPEVIVQDVGEAVDWVLRREGVLI
ncbi:hypothetical protein SpCBS45565_g01853 [Spizellomyces sp. 'palustris']|nr:hypothetical protein SpCBS45565_g01853 [Spizellomyces sp. 'palustris']